MKKIKVTKIRINENPLTKNERKHLVEEILKQEQLNREVHESKKELTKTFELNRLETKN